MHLFLYEFITGGGTYCHPQLGPPHGSLLSEGADMLVAIAQDLHACDGVSLSILRDNRVSLPSLPVRTTVITHAAAARQEFTRLASQCDATLLIAPEIDNCLLDWGQLVHQSGGRLLGPDLTVIELASDKDLTATHLSAHRVPHPAGTNWTRENVLPPLAYPMVAKPIFGAGCWGVKKIGTSDGLREHITAFPTIEAWRFEPFHEGQAASVSAVCTPGSRDWILSPCTQVLSPDLTAYAGSQPISNPALTARAHRIAHSVLQSLPTRSGYLGIDILFGPDPSGSDDVVVEINPRLTSSYLTLRYEYGISIAQRMLEGI